MALHVDFNDIHRYLASGSYPSGVTLKGDKANLRKACKNFKVQNGRLIYLRKSKNGGRTELPVIRTQDEVTTLIQEVHEGLGDAAEAKALRSHHGTRATITILSSRFYWRSIQRDVNNYIQSCEFCQKTNQSVATAKPQLHPVPVINRCWAQVGVDISVLPECDGYTCMVLAVDYFSKWSEGKPLRDKTAASVGRFLYDLICRHGCFDVQINDQGREFVNQVSAELHRLTGVEQRVTSAYHPQANGLVERQNRTVKEKLLKVLEGSHDGWVSALDGVLFAHRTAVHRSTVYSPFFLVYGRQPKLPVDVSLTSAEPTDEEEFSESHMADVVNAMDELRRTSQRNAKSSIEVAQKRQKLDYDKRHQSRYQFREGDRVLLRNMKRADRKGGKSTFPWKGPYIVDKLYSNNTCTLLSSSMASLTQRQNLCNLRPYKERKPARHIPTDSAGDMALQPWLPQLSLTALDKNAIDRQLWLTDSTIDAAQTLLRQQQLDVGGLQSTVLSETQGGYDTAVHPSVQIHYDSNRAHWVTSASCRDRVELADSKYNGLVSDALKSQLFQCYHQYVRNGRLKVHFVPVQQQSNGNDCGVFAVANAGH